jgi:hypothetical protein
VLSRHQLSMVMAILTGHAPVRMHLRTMGLFEGDPACRFCRQEAEQCSTSFVNARWWLAGALMSLGIWLLNLKIYISLQSGRGIRLLNLCWSSNLGLHNKPKAAVHPGQYTDRRRRRGRIGRRKKRKRKKRKKKKPTGTLCNLLSAHDMMHFCT